MLPSSEKQDVSTRADILLPLCTGLGKTGQRYLHACGCSPERAVSSCLDSQTAPECLQKDWLVQGSLKDGGGYRE